MSKQVTTELRKAFQDQIDFWATMQIIINMNDIINFYLNNEHSNKDYLEVGPHKVRNGVIDYYKPIDCMVFINMGTNNKSILQINLSNNLRNKMV
jgi:hypothetical protein